MLTDPIHCPSVEVNLIWNEKIFLIKRALELNPFLSDFSVGLTQVYVFIETVLHHYNLFQTLIN